MIKDIAIGAMWGLVVGLIGLGLAMGISALMADWGDDTPTAHAPVNVRELRCQEDEDIVVTLGNNGLPYGYCQQVGER